VSNWFLGEVSHKVNTDNISIIEFEKKVSPEMLTGLILNARGAINITTAKSVFEEMYRTGKHSDEIIRERGLSQISDTQELEKVAAEVINSNVQPVADYRAGKETALKFLVGQVMKATKGRANPQMVNEVLKKKLAEGAKD
jgi:aspartyl-tRNA(Asn)/glutamyl-tRNA(Gln) amidotransferase subunit B